MASKVEQYFSLSSQGTSVKQELRAAFTTFMAMAYILFLNPQILSQGIVAASGAESIRAQLLTSTALAAAFGSIMMGLFARYPIAVAPGMGLNVYFAFSVVLGQGVPWPIALGTVFVSGIVFLMLSVTGFREAVVQAIPVSLKRAMASGIGLFLSIFGFTNPGIIVAKESTLVGLGSLTSPSVLLTILGLILAVILQLRRVKGALLFAMLTVSTLALALHLPVYQGKSFDGSTIQIMSLPVWPSDLFFSLDVPGALTFKNLSIVITFLLIAFFDTAGTLIGLSEKSKISDAEGRIPRGGRVFITDALATTVGSLLGVSTTTAYVESAAGIEDGGRTGLVAVFVGFMFLISIIFWPLAALIPACATAPALILLGVLMMDSVAKIPWDDLAEAFPAFLTILLIPLTWSISTGIAAGVLSYIVIRLFTGRHRELNPIMYLLGVILLLKFMLA
jgi:adenine/guanine/hypoxanthine permease